MPTIWLTPEQVRQLEDVLWTSFLGAPDEDREEMRALYVTVAKVIRATEPVADTELIAIEMQKTRLAECVYCGQPFPIKRRRPRARYCSPQCKVEAHREKHQQRDADLST